MHKGSFTAIIAVIGLQNLKNYIKRQMRECLLKCCDLIRYLKVRSFTLGMIIPVN